ncbi:hypothetical protein CH380_11360 [Leptospira adleri]|uniref:Uncharacterized protein n=1 Tax=Leptospira adleri TaxID=2023186 RepID=A0A2M9YN96_9LEPT|nr:hypothetical protein CH380_11360 [Leptospira adleri]PJZ62569.1 hypothetical protein CH376_07140 [Leptospira adleri]
MWKVELCDREKSPGIFHHPPHHPSSGWGFYFTEDCRCYDKFFERFGALAGNEVMNGFMEVWRLGPSWNDSYKNGEASAKINTLW